MPALMKTLTFLTSMIWMLKVSCPASGTAIYLDTWVKIVNLNLVRKVKRVNLNF